jgi:hypothetical protein
MRKSVVIGMAAVGVATAGCAGSSEAAGPSTTRNYQVSAFDRLEVAGPYEVTVATGGAPSVQARGAERAIERLVVEVKGHTLKIHSDRRSDWNFGWSRSHPVRVTVTVPNLSAAGISGSGTIAVDKVAGNSFEGGVSGSGGLRVGQVNVKRLKVGIAGSGGFSGAGRAAVAEYDVAGSGDLNAPGLIAEIASVSVAGSGNARAQATRTAKVDVAGSGNVRLTGGAKCSVSKAGSGNVQCS